MKKYLLLLLLPLLSFANIGKIVALKGTALLLTQNSEVQIKVGTILSQKDVIKTNKNSKLQILFEDQTIISLGPKSHFKIDSYFFNKKKESKATFSMLSGTFRTITGKIGKIAPRNFKLKTKSTSIGIRGTQIVANITPTNENIMCTQGQIEVTSFSSGESIIVNVGEMVNINPKKSSQKMKVQKITKEASESSSNQTSNSLSLGDIQSYEVDDFADDLNTLTKEINDLTKENHVVSYNASLSGVTFYSSKDSFLKTDVTSASMSFKIDFGKGRNNDSAITSVLKVNEGTSSSSITTINGRITDSNSLLLNVASTGNEHIQNVGTIITGTSTIEERTLNFVGNTSNIIGTNLVLSSDTKEKIEINKLILQKQ